MIRTCCIAFLILVLISSFLQASDQGVISGHVYNDAGSKGIWGATVCIYNVDGDIVESIETSAGGWFEFHVPSGEYLVSAEKGNYIREFYPGYYSISEADGIKINPGHNASIAFNLERGGWLGGVFDIRGEDVDHALVTVLKLDHPYAGWYKSETFDGTFPVNYVVSGLIPGVYKVLGQATDKYSAYFPGVEDFDDALPVTVIRNAGVPDISFLLEPTGSGTISGRVFDIETGEGLGGVAISAYQWRNFHEDPNLKMTSTGQDGSFILTISAGTYYLSAQCDECISGSGRIALYYDNQLDPTRADPVQVEENADIENIDFAFDFTNSYDLSISGRVLDHQTGIGLSGVVVTALDYYTGIPVSSSYSVRDGDFSIENLSSGEYLLMFSEMNVIPYFYRGDETWQNAEIIELTADFGGIQSEAITQDYGNLGLAISGQVTSQSGPLNGARIYAYLVGDDYPTAFARTNASGEYAIINGLVPGAYIVVCDLYGYDYQTYPDIIELDLLNDPSRENIDFYLEQPSTGIVDEDIEMPGELQVLSNYPNPFNARTVIQVYSPYDVSIDVGMKVFDILGRRTGERNLVINPGINNIIWGLDDFDKDVSSGIYYYRIDGISGVFRMVLLK
jgi:hypothetical protein